MKLSTRIALGYGFLLGLLIIIAIINVWLSNNVRKNSKEFSQAEDAMRLSANFYNLFTDMQSGFRGYIASGDEDFLEDYYRGEREIQPTYNELKANVRNDSVQVRLLDNMYKKSFEWRNDYAGKLIKARTEGKNDPVAKEEYLYLFNSIFRTKVGKTMMDEVRDDYYRFADRQVKVLKLKKEELEKSLTLVDSITIVLTIFSLVTGILAARFIISSVRRRIRNMSELAEKISRGNFDIAINDHRGDDLARLSKMLNRMAKALKVYFTRLERTNKELENFAFMASHDLKEPVRMVSNYTQMLAAHYGDKLGPEAKEYMDYAVEGANRIKMLINDLLSYSKIGHSEFAFSMVDMNAVMDFVTSQLKKEIETSGAQVKYENLPNIRANPELITEVMLQLIDNAIKFRGEERLMVHVKSSAFKNGWIFSVHDNGIGINKEYHDKVFTIFQRLHERGKYPGTGIGLPICKKIIEQLGGKIWFESEEGKGTTFYFTIPEEGNNFL